MGTQFGMNQASNYPQYYGGQVAPLPIVTGYDGLTSNFGYNSYKNLEYHMENNADIAIGGFMISDFSNPYSNEYHDALGYAEAGINAQDLDGSGTYSLDEHMKYQIEGMTKSGYVVTDAVKEDVAKNFAVRDRNKDGQIDRLEDAASVILFDSPDAWALLDAYGGDIRYVPPSILARLDGFASTDDRIAAGGLDDNTKGRLLDNILNTTDLRNAETTYQSPLQQQRPAASYPVGLQAFMQQMFSMMQQMMQMFQR